MSNVFICMEEEKGCHEITKGTECREQSYYGSFTRLTKGVVDSYGASASYYISCWSDDSDITGRIAI